MNSRSSSLRWVGALAALGFLAGHIPFLVWFLDDIDPINFAMGVRYYDIAQHQPHPPGYPIFILLGKIAAWGLTALGWHPNGDLEAGALALWGIIAGALAAFPLLMLFTQVEQVRGRAVWAMALTLACPLFWFTAGRPLTDVPGLAAALVSVALLAAAFAKQGEWARRQEAANIGANEPGDLRANVDEEASRADAQANVFDASGVSPVSAGAGGAGGADAGATASPIVSAGGNASRRATVTGVSVTAISSAELAASGKLIVAGALVAGLAIGLRSQTFWLTLPVLALVIFDRAGRGAAGALLGSLITFGAGVVAWFVPMVIATGGPSAYIAALYSQGAEDFTGVDMLATSAAPVQRLIYNLIQTFVAPWASVPLALVVLAFAGLGLCVMLARARRGLMLLAVMTLPYAALHLLFHENETIRYALPLVVPVAYLAVRGLDAVLRRVSFAVAAALVLASLAIGAPALQAYARGTSPIFQLFDDMTRTPVDAARPPVVAMHRRVFNESRRARQWAGPAFTWTLLPSTRGHEWLDVVKHWRDGQDTPVWFIGDPRRTDLALIDPTAREHARRYRWPLVDASDPISRFFLRKLPQAFDDPALIGGARPDEMDWYVLDRPGWFLEEGWALTPETSGVADADGKGPARGGIVGYVRRRPDEVRLMIGGRNLGASGDGVVRFTAALDGRVLDTWDILPSPGFFLKAFTLPAGALLGEGTFGRLTVQAQAADPASAPAGSQPPPVRAAIEQFDLQASSAVMFGFDTGWHEGEYQPKTGLSWRWASGAAALRVWNAGRDVRLRLRAESPLRYFDSAPTVTVKAGSRELLSFPADGDVDITVDVPAAALEASGGALVVTTDRTFSPAEREPGVTDQRRLGLRVFDVSITAR